MRYNLEKCTNCKDTHALSTMEQPHPRNVLLKLHMNIALEKDPGAWIRHGKKTEICIIMSFLQSHDVKDGVNGEWKMLYMVYI